MSDSIYHMTLKLLCNNQNFIFGVKRLGFCHINVIGVVTHLRNKNSNIQGRPPNVVKVIFHTIKNCS